MQECYKTGLEEIGFKDVDWIRVTKDQEVLQAVVNLVTNHQVHKS
jgi:hypothetical protein